MLGGRPELVYTDAVGGLKDDEEAEEEEKEEGDEEEEIVSELQPSPQEGESPCRTHSSRRAFSGLDSLNWTQISRLKVKLLKQSRDSEKKKRSRRLCSASVV